MISFLKLIYFVCSPVFSSAAHRGGRTTTHVATGPALPMALGTRHQAHQFLPQPPFRGCSALGGRQGHMAPREHPATGDRVEPAGIEVQCSSALILAVAPNVDICHAPHHTDLYRAHSFLPKHYSCGNHWRANELLVSRVCHGCVTLQTATVMGFFSFSQPLMPWLYRIIKKQRFLFLMPLWT